MRLSPLAVAVVVVLSLSPVAGAKEGMWVPQQLPEIGDELKQAGLQLDPRQLADLTGDPMGAVVAVATTVPSALASVNFAVVSVAGITRSGSTE